MYSCITRVVTIKVLSTQEPQPFCLVPVSHLPNPKGPLEFCASGQLSFSPSQHLVNADQEFTSLSIPSLLLYFLFPLFSFWYVLGKPNP